MDPRLRTLQDRLKAAAAEMDGYEIHRHLGQHDLQALIQILNEVPVARFNDQQGELDDREIRLNRILAEYEGGDST